MLSAHTIDAIPNNIDINTTESTSISNKIWNCVYTIKPYLQTTLARTAAITTAIPSTIYALVFPSGERVSALGEAWWHNMTIGNQLFSIATGCAAFATNTLTNAKYISEATEKLKVDLTKCCSDPKQLLKTTVYIILASFAALAAVPHYPMMHSLHMAKHWRSAWHFFNYWLMAPDDTQELLHFLNVFKIFSMRM